MNELIIFCIALYLLKSSAKRLFAFKLFGKRHARNDRKSLRTFKMNFMKLSNLIYDTTDTTFIFAHYLRRKYIEKIDVNASNKKVIKIKNYKSKK